MLDVRLSIQMIQDENKTRDRFAGRLREQPLEEAVESGEVLGPLRMVSVPGRFDFMEASAYYSRFRKGDKVDLRLWDGGGALEEVGEIEIKGVSYPREGAVRLEITRKRDKRPVRGKDYFLYPSASTYLDRKLLEAVRESAQTTRPQRPAGLQNLRRVSPATDQELNKSQEEAFRYLADCGQDGCTQGPPGTGKTRLLRALVHAAVESGLSVGLAGFTHAAVDNAFSRLRDLPSIGDFVRVGNKIKIKQDLYPGGWVWNRHVASFSMLPSTPQLVAATAHSWILSSRAPIVDLLIVDEAGQVPAYMGDALARNGRHAIYLGDHRQLPPVLQANHPNVPAEDIFSLQLQSEEGAPMLKTQYRMNRDVQAWSAERYYEGRLHPHPTNADRDILAEPAVLHPELGTHPVQLLTHDFKGQNQSNRGEADLVAEKVEQLLNHGGIPPTQLGVIAPHRMQNGAICRALQHSLGCQRATEILVDTVERFQGQEREVILLSFGCDADTGTTRGSRHQFLGDARRINVSITRARSRFYCVASEKLLRFASKLRRSNAHPELADFFTWCREPALVA